MHSSNDQQWVEPLYVSELITLFAGDRLAILRQIPDVVAGIVTVTPIRGIDASDYPLVTAELLRVTSGGPILILATEDADKWADAFASHGAEIRRREYQAAITLIAANINHVVLPDEESSITGLVDYLVGEVGAGTILDPFASAALTAVPVIGRGLKWVGIDCSDGYCPDDTIKCICSRMGGHYERKPIREGLDAA